MRGVNYSINYPFNNGKTSIVFEAIDAHGLKIQGRGYGMFLPKFLGGVKGVGNVFWLPIRQIKFFGTIEF